MLLDSYIGDIITLVNYYYLFFEISYWHTQNILFSYKGEQNWNFNFNKTFLAQNQYTFLCF